MRGATYSYPQIAPSTDIVPGPASLQESGPSHFQTGHIHATALNKKRRIDRACDGCRRRKTKCDGPKMPDNVCSNCLQTKKSCTYLEDSKPRGPSKAHVTGLEDRMEKLEKLLKQLRPEIDLSSELGPPIVLGSWKTDGLPSNTPPFSFQAHKGPYSNLATQQTLSQSSELPHAVDSPIGRSTHLVFELQPPQQLHQPPGEDTDNESTSSDQSSSSRTLEIENVTGLIKKLKLRGTENDADRPVHNNPRFHGRSSTIPLVEAIWKFKSMHRLATLESAQPSHDSPPGMDELPIRSLTRRPEFWRTPTWERVWEGLSIESPELFSSVLAEFPPTDLAEKLINLYFLYPNSQFPLLHRPTFDRQWRENLHHKNVWFAGVCVLMFAVASRFTDDPRVIKGNVGANTNTPDWGLAGWGYFDVAIGIHRARRSLFYPASLFEIQTFPLIGMFLRTTSSSSAAWILVSIGIRKVQDVGAHRQNVYRSKPTVDEELWKRAFWCLIVFDRLDGAILGRGSSVGEEDFDVDLPLEVDDEYWEPDDPCLAFQQPQGLPNYICAFNLFIKLTKIVAFALKSVYALDKSKVFCGLNHSNWSREMVEQLDVAMTEWKTLVPEYLVWSPQMGNSIFATQAATLETFYHYVQMLIYRPFIPSPLLTSGIGTPSINQALQSSFPYPAMEICVKSARLCARIAEAQVQNGLHIMPVQIQAAQVSAAMLLIKIWDLKYQERAQQTQSPEDIKPLFIQQIEPLLADVNVIIHILEQVEPRSRLVSSFLPQLRECLPDGSYGYKSVEHPVHAPAIRSTPTPSGNLYSPQDVMTPSRIPPQSRSPPLSQNQDQYWQLRSSGGSRYVAEQTRPVGLTASSPEQRSLAQSFPHHRNIDPPIFLKREVSPVMRPPAQEHSDREKQDHPQSSYPHDPRTWPYSQYSKPNYHRVRTVSSSIPIPFTTADKTVSHMSNTIGRTSFPAYSRPEHEAFDGDEQYGTEGILDSREGRNITKYGSISAHHDNPIRHKSVHHYPHSTSGQKLVSETRSYRMNRWENQSWDQQHPRCLPHSHPSQLPIQSQSIYEAQYQHGPGFSPEHSFQG